MDEMTDGRLIFTREELYDLVWSKAVSRVAPELGISDVALRKRCRAAGIPVPDATYWGKAHAGKQARRAPLGPTPQGSSGKVVIRPTRREVSPEVKVAIDAAKSMDLAPQSRARRHPAVARTLATARKAPEGMQGGQKTGGDDVFATRSHLDTLDRLGTFLDKLVASAKSRGYSVAAATGGLGFDVDGEVVGFFISQTIRKFRHEATPEEIARRERWDRRHRGDWDRWSDRPTIPFYDFTPTGEMSLEIGGWPRPSGVTHRFADTKARKIEERVDDMMVPFAAHSAAMRVARREDEERKVRQQRDREESARRAREAELEKTRLDYLEKKLGEFRKVRDLRELLDLLKDSPADLGSFLSWATTHLAQLERAISADTVRQESERLEAFKVD